MSFVALLKLRIFPMLLGPTYIFSVVFFKVKPINIFSRLWKQKIPGDQMQNAEYFYLI